MDPHRVMSVHWALIPYPSGSSKRIPPNRAPTKRCSLSRALQLSLKIPNQQTPQVPQWATMERERHPSPEFLVHLSLKVPGKWASPSTFPNRVPMEREASSPEPMVDSFIYICRDPQYGALPQKVGKTFSHCPWSPMWMESLHTMGCGLVPQGDRSRHCNLYPSAM